MAGAVGYKKFTYQFVRKKSWRPFYNWSNELKKQNKKKQQQFFQNANCNGQSLNEGTQRIIFRT